MEIDYQTIYNYLHGGKCPAGMDAWLCKPQANKAKKFVNEDGVLHYITKEWMHTCFQKKEMQPFPLTRSSHPDSPASPELVYLLAIDKWLKDPYPCKSNGIVTCQWLYCKIVTIYLFQTKLLPVLFDMDIRYTLVKS